MAFIIDTVGVYGGQTKTISNKNSKFPKGSLISQLLEEYNNSNAQSEDSFIPLNSNASGSSSQICDIETVPQYRSLTTHTKNDSDAVQKFKVNKELVAEALKKSFVLTPEFDKLHRLPPIHVSDRTMQKTRKKEREKTKGQGWFNLPATEVTPEIKRDLQLIQMRSVLDPKRFYKKNDMKDIPKYSQVGTVIESPLDFYSGRLTKKERKKTLVDELLADAEFKKFNKRKYKEVIQQRAKRDYKTWVELKKSTKKKQKKKNKKKR